MVNNIENFELNLSGVTTDGASTLVGVNNGLISKLKSNLNANFIATRDPCHQLHIILKSLYKKMPDEIYKKVTTIANYFLHSPSRENKLKYFTGKKILKPVATRWTSVGSCITRLLEIWDGLEDFMIM